MTEENGVTLEDALSVLNTDILAGKGPDVLILDGMPADSYIEKGVLADISDVVGEASQKDGIFGNIIESSKKDGKVYAMPARILLPVVLGDEKTRSTGGSLPALADRVKALSKSTSKSVIPDDKGTKTLLRDCYYADSARFLAGDGSLNQDVIREYLTQAKCLYDVDKHDKKEDYFDKIAGDGTMDGAKAGSCSDQGLLTGEWRLSFGTLDGMYHYQTMVSERKDTKADICLMNGDRVKTYVPYLTAGVTMGGNVDGAKEFVATLLGKEAGIRDSDGFSVNRAAFEELCKEKMDDPLVKKKNGACVGFSGPDGKMCNITFVNLKQTDVDKLTNMVESLPVLLALSLGVAVLLSRKGKAGHLLKSAYLVPLAIPAASVVLLWQLIFDNSGVLNGALHFFQLEGKDWMHTDSAFFVLVFSYIWKNLGYDVILWMAGLQDVSESIYEAAKVDGAGAWKSFCYITLPNIRPTAFTVVILSFLNSFKVFREAYLVAGNYPQENIYLMQHLFNNWFSRLSVDKMAAGSVLLCFVITVCVLLLQRRWEGDKD